MGQPLIFSLIDKAIFEYKMIEDNDKILVASSGGKDSTALVEYFSLRAKRRNCNFKYKAIHIESEITKPISDGLLALFNSWNVDFENVKIEVLGRLKKNKKMNCWWCSTQRRTDLINYALANGYNKLALGHHLDDILETWIMNMLERSEMSTMPPFLAYEKYPLKIIRPLCYVTEDKIIEHAQTTGYISSTCTCNYQSNSTRKRAREKLDFLCDNDSEKKERLFAALHNVLPEYLP